MTPPNIRDAIIDPLYEPFKQYKNLILAWSTGVGKSFAAISLQKTLPNPKTYIVVAETSHINGWKAEYKKHNVEYLLENTEIFCYHSLHKYVNKKVDLIILDEFHHISDARFDSLSTIKVEYKVSLSATITKEDTDKIYNLWGRYKISKVDLAKAVTMGILTEPELIFLGLELDNTLKTETIEIKKGKPVRTINLDYSMRKNIASLTNCIINLQCTEQEKYTYLTDTVERLKRSFFTNRNEYIKQQWLMSGSERKRYLGSLKTEYIRTLANELKGSKFICFCGSIEQAEALSPNFIHSKQPVKLQKQILEDFNANKFSSLYAIGKLKEGSNLNDIETGIIGQLDNQTRSFIQKVGRILRNKVDPKVYILYFKDTQDQIYVETATLQTNNDFITYEIFDRYITVNKGRL